MALFDDINKANAELERLREQYKDISNITAPKFDVKNIDDANKAIDTMVKAIRQAKKEADDLEAGFGGILNTIQGTLKELTKTSDPVKKITKEFRSQESITRKLKDDQSGINKLSMDELKTLEKKALSNRDEINSQAEIIKQKFAGIDLDKNGNKLAGGALRQRLKGLSEEEKKKRGITAADEEIFMMGKATNNVNDELIEKLKARIQAEERIEKAMGVTGGIINSIKGTLDTLGMGGLSNILNLDEAQKAMRKVAEELDDSEEGVGGFGDQLTIARAGIEKMAEGLANALSDPLVFSTMLLNGLIKSFQHLDKTTGDIAKNMNMTYDEALALTGELKQQAKESGNVFVTTEGMAESMLAVNEALGTSVQLSAEQAAQFTEMREAAGFTNEELVAINAISVTTGKSIKEISGEFMAQARLKGQELGVALNEKEVLKDIQNVSAATTLSFGKNPGLIAEAVAATKALGLEMGKVEGIADSLLDFEGSIAQEMEAELLLGKNLNLEKARQAALDNDLATLAEEIAKNVGDSADFAAMNRIQQEALAKSVGMNREDLAQMLFTQEQLVGLSAEETALREKQISELEAKGLTQAQIKEELANTSIAQLEEQASISDRMNASMEKLNEAFGTIAMTVMPFFSGLASAAAALAEMPIVAGILVGVLGGLAAMSAIIAVSNMIAAIGAIFGSFGKIPFGIGIPLAFAAVGGLIGLVSKGASSIKAATKDDVMFPGSGGSGYGDRMISAPEGTFALNNKDTIIAGTNLFRANDMISAPAGGINLGGGGSSEKTNQLLTQMVSFQKKQPGFSRVSLYEVQ
tara:strand:+ start:42 stop:2474 length:2433 start_codon:yes stop_codon:yes gene_type:complete